LPFKDGAFDVALSTFGAMFTPDQNRRLANWSGGAQGGRIGMANWTPEGFIANCFA